VAKRQFTVYLLKDGTDLDDAAKADVADTRHVLRRGLPFTGRLYVQHARPVPPNWLQFVAEGVQDEVGRLMNSHCSALLLLKAGRRVFAITFGYGRSMLKQELIERRFGLLILLNRVDPEKLRSLDTYVFEDLAVQTKRQTSRAAGVLDFGVDPTRDIVRAVTGEPDNQEFGKRISGSDAVVVTVDIAFADLGDLCTRLLRAFRETRYRERFAWVDYIKKVQDPTQIARLDGYLIEELRAGNTDTIYLAPPESVEWENVDGVRYKGTGARGAQEEMDLDTYLRLLREPNAISIEQLKSHRIELLSAQSQQRRYGPWSVYECIVYERSNPGVHALVAGEWLEADRDYAAEITASVAQIPVTTPLDLPAFGRDDDEPAYNKRVGRDERDIVCMDCKHVDLPGMGRIEACDLYGPGKTIRHVKQRRSSAMLSHLWNQGLVSSELLVSTTAFAPKMRETLSQQLATKPNGPHTSLLATFDPASFRAADYRVQFVLLGGKRPLPGSLPFFSKVTLSHTYRRIRSWGYQVEIMQIQRTAV
jgi:uncharacterized protein (TIGR04141 family)